MMLLIEKRSRQHTTHARSHSTAVLPHVRKVPHVILKRFPTRVGFLMLFEVRVCVRLSRYVACIIVMRFLACARFLMCAPWGCCQQGKE